MKNLLKRSLALGAIAAMTVPMSAFAAVPTTGLCSPLKSLSSHLFYKHGTCSNVGPIPIDVNFSTTQMADGSIQITASHNAQWLCPEESDTFTITDCDPTTGFVRGSVSQQNGGTVLNGHITNSQVFSNGKVALASDILPSVYIYNKL